MTTSTSKHLSSLGFALAIVLGTPTASAQAPDPFTDYEASKSGTPPARVVTTKTVTVAPTSRAELSTTPGSFSLGLRSMLSYSTRTNELETGEDATNKTLFVRAAPTLHVFVKDKLEITAGVGPMLTTLAKPGGSSARESDWLLELGAHYYLMLSPRFAFAPGLSIGPYFGSSTQKITVFTEAGEERRINQKTDTLGVAGTLYLSAVFQVYESFQLRSGLAITGLWGREKLADSNTKLSSKAANLSIPVELYYTF